MQFLHNALKSSTKQSAKGMHTYTLRKPFEIKIPRKDLPKKLTSSLKHFSENPHSQYMALRGVAETSISLKGDYKYLPQNEIPIGTPCLIINCPQDTVLEYANNQFKFSKDTQLNLDAKNSVFDNGDILGEITLGKK